MDRTVQSMKKAYSSVDKGCTVAFLGGVYMGLIPAYLLAGYSDSGPYLLFSSFMFFFAGKYFALKPLFDKNQEEL